MKSVVSLKCEPKMKTWPKWTNQPTDDLTEPTNHWHNDWLLELTNHRLTYCLLLTTHWLKQVMILLKWHLDVGLTFIHIAFTLTLFVAWFTSDFTFQLTILRLSTLTALQLTSPSNWLSFDLTSGFNIVCIIIIIVNIDWLLCLNCSFSFASFASWISCS